MYFPTFPNLSSSCLPLSMIVFRCPSLLLLPILETSIDNLFLQFLSCLRSRDLCPRRFYVIKTQADHTELLRAALGGLKFSFRPCRLRRPLGPAEPRSPWLLMACILAQATDFSFRAMHSPEKAVPGLHFHQVFPPARLLVLFHEMYEIPTLGSRCLPLSLLCCENPNGGAWRLVLLLIQIV